MAGPAHGTTGGPRNGRLAGKVAIVMGGGQTTGETIGNGRASAIVYAREGASVLVVDREIESAQDTCDAIRAEGGIAEPAPADATASQDCERIAALCVEHFGTPDILHNNVGIGVDDNGLTSISEHAWDMIIGVNLKSVLMPCKHVLPLMRERGSGVIINISSVAAIATTRMVAYKASKAGVNAMTQQLAMTNARFGIRVNAIMPGLMDTPMAIEGFSGARGITRDELRAERNARVPLNQQMGTGWDIANAAAFLASDDARFITGVLLPVDGGQSVRIG
jgi:NAD(P)-dependent dehydrogenase (short-subunit alcohol dehydrogenase family)